MLQRISSHLSAIRLVVLAGGLLVSGLQAQAQVDNYQFTAYAGTFAPLPAGATPAASIQADDALSPVIPIGFVFVFDGTPYSSVKVSSNGWLSFNSAAAFHGINNDLDNGSANERPLVAPFWDDLHGGTGTASHSTTGVAPNRVFTFEWLNWYRFGNSGGPTFSMQVQLFEGSNMVRFVYRRELVGTFTSTNASIGLSGAGTGSGSFLSLSDASANPAVSSVTEVASIPDRPATGQVYEFTPPAASPCPVPRNLTATVSSTSATVSYSVTNNPAGPFTIVYGPAGFDPATGGTAIPGVTGPSATISGLAPNTAYQFYVTQNCGGANGNSVRSNPGSFTTEPAPAANDECVTAITLPETTTCATPTNGTVLGATQSLPVSGACGSASIPAMDVWYSFVASGPTQYLMLNARFFSALEVRAGSCASSAVVSCNTVAANNSNALLINGLSSGQTYFLRVYANSNTQPTAANSTFALCLNPGPPVPGNDECANAAVLPVTANCATPTAGTVTAASQSLPPTASCGFGSTAADVWYRFTATGTAHLLSFVPSFNGVVDVRTGTCASSSSIYCNTATAFAARMAIVPGLTVGQTYFLRVYAANGSPTGPSATFSLCINPAPPAPANDDCASATTVPVQFGPACQGYTAGDNTSATASPGVADPTCGGYRGADIWFRTVVPPSGTVTVRTVPTSPLSPVTDTGMSVYSGACGSLLVQGCNDNNGGSYSLLTVSNRLPGEVLYIRVWSFNNNTFGPIGVCVTSPSSCPSPLGPGWGNLTNTTAELTWNPGGGPVGSTYTVEYGEMGFALGTGSTITNIAGTSTTLTGLMPATNYCYYLRQDCPNMGSSPFVGPTCFTTPLIAPNNDEPCGAILLTGNSVTGTNVGATTSLQPGIILPASCSPARAPKDVWFYMVPTSSSTTLSLTGSSAGMVRVFTSADCANGLFDMVFCRASGANNQGVGTVSVTGLTPGQRYYVAVSGYGSSDTPGSFTLRGTALSSRAQATSNSLLVYPNPSSTGQLTLRLEAGQAAGHLSLLNALGQSVLQAGLAAGATEQQLSTRALASGVYTLRVQLGSEVLTRKVVLE